MYANLPRKRPPQNMLAFFFAIDNFNRDNNLGVQLGGLAIDTCSSPVRVTRDVFSLLMGQGLCEAKGIGTKVGCVFYYLGHFQPVHG